eukprot:274437-Chlamydomonas_euryale.AAC.1
MKGCGNKREELWLVFGLCVGGVVGRQAGRQASRQAGKQAGRQAGRQTCQTVKIGGGRDGQHKLNEASADVGAFTPLLRPHLAASTTAPQVQSTELGERIVRQDKALRKVCGGAAAAHEMRLYKQASVDECGGIRDAAVQVGGFGGRVRAAALEGTTAKAGGSLGPTSLTHPESNMP